MPSTPRGRRPRKLPPLPRGDPPWDGRAIRCALCGRAGIAGDRSGGEWRAIEADAVLHYVCPAEFPADGSSKAAWEAAYKRVFRALRLRIGPNTDLVIQEVEDA